MKQPFWINYELGQQNSVSHFCLIARVELLDCDYRVVGSLILLLAISEIIPGLARTIGDCIMSEFIHYVLEKSLLFMLVLVGHDGRSLSLQINITKDITSIVQWVKYFSMISFPCILLLYGILIAFSILVLTANTQPAIACSVLIMEVLEQHVGCVQVLWLCIYVYMCMCEYMYVCIYVCVYVFVCKYVYVCIYI